MDRITRFSTIFFAEKIWTGSHMNRWKRFRELFRFFLPGSTPVLTWWKLSSRNTPWPVWACCQPEERGCHPRSSPWVAGQRGTIWPSSSSLMRLSPSTVGSPAQNLVGFSLNLLNTILGKNLIPNFSLCYMVTFLANCLISNQSFILLIITQFLN